MLWQFIFLACASLAHPQPQETTTHIPRPVCNYEGKIPEHEMPAFEAVCNLHKQLDDDANGNIDLEESEEFLREELEYVGNRQGKLEKFHGKKKMVSVEDFWNTWNTSQAHGWTVDDVAEWMDTHLMLPQYRESVIQHQINGTMLPELTNKKNLTLLQLLGIDDSIHRQKISIKAMEVVLFGPPREYISGRNLKWIFTSVLVGFLTLSWFAYRQIRLSNMKLAKVMKDLDRLANAEKAFARLQAEHEVLSNKHGYTDENGERRLLSENDTENLGLKYEQLKVENELLCNRLKEIEQKTSWKTPTELAHWLQLTYEIETASFNRKREQAELQLAAARRACDQLKKKRSNVISAFISTHGNGLEDVDGSITQARNALMDVTRDLGERAVRWRTIERICGISVISNPGLNYLRFVLKNDSRFFQSSDSGSEAAANFQEYDGPVMKTPIPETSLRLDPSFSTPVREQPARLADFPVSPVVDKMLRKDSSDMILGMEADMLRPRSSSASTARVFSPVDLGLEEKKNAPTVLAMSLIGLVTSDTYRPTHTNNWAVLVDTSRFWFNYRHVANLLSVYRSVKRLGIPDSQIILMMADDMACNPRNPRPASVFNNAKQHIDVYGEEIEVDYRGYEVTVENFVRLLTGRLPSGTPRSKQLLTDEGSNILIYMTGHGGDGFLKFQDAEEITNVDLADAFEQMWQKKRYNEILYIVDTCQAASMFQRFYSPNILAVGSSLVGEDSLSHHVDPAIGVYIIDRYTYFALEFLEGVTRDSDKTLSEFLEVCPKRHCLSTVGIRSDLFRRNPRDVRVTEFFGSVRPVEAFSLNEKLFSNWERNDSVRMSQPSVVQRPSTKATTVGVRYQYGNQLMLPK